MAKRIESKDVFAPNLADDTIKSLQGLLVVVNDIENSFKLAGQNAETFAKNADFSTSKGIDTFLKKSEEVNQLFKDSVELQKSKKKIEVELTKAIKEEEKVKQEQLKTQKEAIKLQVEEQKLVQTSIRTKAQQEKLEAQILKTKTKNNQEVTKELKTITDFKNRNKQLEESLQKVVITTAKGLEEYTKIYKEIVNNKQVINSLDKELKQLVQTQQKQLDLEEALFDAGNDLIKSKNDAIRVNKILREAVNDLNVELDANTIKKYNEIIDRNTQLINENSDAYVQQKMNIGNYEESVQNALSSTQQFSDFQEKLALILKVLNKIRDLSNVKQTISNKLQDVAIVKTTIQNKASLLYNKTKLALIKSIGKTNEGLENEIKLQEELAKATSNTQEKVDDLNSSLKKGVIGAIVTFLGALAASYTQTAEGSDKLRLALDSFNDVLTATIKALGDFVKNGLNSINIFFNNFSIKVEEAKITVQQFALSTANTFGLANNLTTQLTQNIAQSTQKVAELTEENKKLNDEIDKNNAQKNGKGYLQILGEILDRNKDLLEFEKRVTKERRTLEKQNEKEIAQQEILKEFTGANTLSLVERIRYNNILSEQNLKVAQIQTKLAQNELDLIEKQINKQLELQGVTLSTQQIRNLNESEFAKLISNELLDKQTEGIKALTQAQNNYKTTQLANINELSQNRQDQFELEFDVTEDFFDALKVKNERQIASEKESLQVKKQIFQETQKLVKQSFDTGIKLLEDEILAAKKANVEKLKIAGASQEEIFRAEKDALNFKIDAEKLLNANSVEAYIEEVKRLNAAEILNNRVLMNIREQVAVRQDMVDLGNDINDEEKESLESQKIRLIKEKELLEVRKKRAELDILLAKDVTKLSQEELEERKLAIEQYQKEISEIEYNYETETLEKTLELRKKALSEQKEGSKEYLVTKQEITDIELDLEKRKQDKVIELDNEKTEKALENIKKEEEALAKKQEKEKELRDAGISFLSNLSQERNQRIQESLDKELEKTKEQKNSLKELATKGSEDAIKNLQFEQKRQAEIERDKQRAIKRQKQEEFGLAVVKAYSNNAGQPDALAKTLTETIALRELVANLPAFFQGTEDTGKAQNPLDKNGGRLAILHDNERVMTAKQNEKTKGLSNDKLAQIGHEYKNGLLFHLNKFSPQILLEKQTNSESPFLIDEVKGMRQELEKLPSKLPHPSYYFDEQEKMMVSVIQSQSKINRTHHKNNSIWR